MKWASLALKFLPMVLSFIPRMPPSLGPLVANGIVEAEGIPGATGTEKKQHVLNLAADALVAINSAKNHQVVDVDQAMLAVSAGIDAGVAAVNVLHPHVATTPATV